MDVSDTVIDRTLLSVDLGRKGVDPKMRNLVLYAPCVTDVCNRR